MAHWRFTNKINSQSQGKGERTEEGTGQAAPTGPLLSLVLSLSLLLLWFSSSALLAHSSSDCAGGGPRTPAAPGVHGMVVLVATAARWPGGSTAARARPPAARCRAPLRVVAEPEHKAATVRFGTRHWKKTSSCRDLFWCFDCFVHLRTRSPPSFRSLDLHYVMPDRHNHKQF
jgi:hypothetical protein